MSKKVAVFIWIAGGIGSVILGQVFSIQGRYSWEAQYNFMVCIAALVTTFIQGALFWGIGEVVDKLTETNSYLHHLNSTGADNKSNTAQVQPISAPANAMEKSINGEWICSLCKTSNKETNIHCTSCGSYR